MKYVGLKRVSLAAALVTLLVVLGTGVVLAGGLFVIPDEESGDVVGAPELAPTGEQGEFASEVDGVRSPDTDLSAVSDGAEAIIASARKDLTPVAVSGDTALEYDSVRFVLSNGDIVDVDVQALTSVERPGSYIQPNWRLGSVGPYEAAFEPRDEDNTSEGVWLLTDHYQIGAYLLAPPKSRLATDPGSTDLVDIALKFASGLEG